MKCLAVISVWVGFVVQTSFCLGQQMDQIYLGISSDSVHHNHQLILKNDSVLELRMLPRYMTGSFTMTFTYTRNSGVVNIDKQLREPADSLELINNGLSQFNNPVTLTVDNNALLDKKNLVVYVLLKDFKSSNYMTYIIDGKRYKQDLGEVNSYGLSQKNPRTNIVLKRKLKAVTNHIEDYSMNVYKGIHAYRKFGYKSVFGVIELTKRIK